MLITSCTKFEIEDHAQYQLRRNPGEELSWNGCKFYVKLDKPPTETISKTKGKRCKNHQQTPQGFVVNKINFMVSLGT